MKTLLFYSIIIALPLFLGAQAHGSQMLGTDYFNRVKEDYPFTGLAFYYNSLKYFTLSEDQLLPAETRGEYTISKNDQFIVAGRFKIMTISATERFTATIDSNGITVKIDKGALHTAIYSRDELKTVSGKLDSIRYNHLFWPLNELSKIIEWILTTLNTLTNHWGATIIVFAVLLKLLLVPISIITINMQRKVSQYQAQLHPVLQDIQENYEGEEAHNKVMEAYKHLGITPFHKLKPMLTLFIQIPIMIASFNALGEMPQFQDQSFLWISNLAYPDSIMTLSFAIPFLGDQLSCLPFVMTIAMLAPTLMYQNEHAPATEVKWQKRNLYLMTLAFFILLYAFPAAMVLYWTIVNILQTIQQQFIKI